MPALNLNKIDVHIKTPIINCTPKGGNVHAQHHNDQMRWVSNDAPFTLAFADLDGTGGAIWPFVEAQPGWPVTDTGPLTLDVNKLPTYLKYTVKADQCGPLDPIIILDRN